MRGQNSDEAGVEGLYRGEHFSSRRLGQRRRPVGRGCEVFNIFYVRSDLRYSPNEQAGLPLRAFFLDLIQIDL